MNKTDVGIRRSVTWVMCLAVIILALFLSPALAHATHFPGDTQVAGTSLHDGIHDHARHGHSADQDAADHEHQFHGLPVKPRGISISAGRDVASRRVPTLIGTIRDGPRKPPRAV